MEDTSTMRTNATKAKLTEGKVVFGAIISRHAPDLVELFGLIGYDFVTISSRWDSCVSARRTSGGACRQRWRIDDTGGA